MPRSDQRRKFNYLNNYHVLCDFKFDPIKDYLDKSQDMIKVLQKELKDKYDAWESKNKSSLRGPDAFDVFEIEIMTIGEYDSILNNSTFLAIYSIFETEFLNICLYCQKTEGLKLGPKDLNGKSYIDQCRKFITKLLKVNLDRLNPEWELIQKYRKVRNLIAHGNGKIQESTQNLIDFIDRTNGIEYDRDEKIVRIISIDFLKNFIDLLSNYLVGICNEIFDQKN